MKKTWLYMGPICLLLTVVLYGCHKRESVKTQSAYTYINQTGRQITFDVYQNKEDYNKHQNRLHQYIIEPDASQQIVSDINDNYWVDWYSAGYTYNNWQSANGSYNRSIPQPEINIGAEDEQILITAATLDTARSVLLGGGGTSSKWRSNITGNSVDLNGMHEFTFNKDFTGEYMYINTKGDSSSSPTPFFIESGISDAGIPQRFIARINDNLGSYSFAAFCNTGFTGIANPHTGRDTMWIQFRWVSHSPSFPFVRQ